GKWLFTKYDKFGRVVYTGSINNAASRESLQTTVNSFENNNESRTTQSFTQNGSTVYYTKTAFPTSFSDVFSVNYYDTYDNLGFTVPSSILGESDLRKLNDQTKGMPLASFVRVIGTTNWEKTFTVYDKKSQAVGVYKTNHLGGFTETESKLKFSGVPEYTLTKHKRANNGLEVKIKDEFTYDSQLRLTLHTQSLNNIPQKNLIAKNEYDKLGQLITKEVGGTPSNATDRWQEINYKYNIRGWLTNINDIRELMAGKGLPPPSPSDDLFSFAIQYNQLIEPGSGDYTSPLYNGNIAQTFWKTASDNTLRGYNYEYDQLNRLLNAEFYKKGTSPYSGAYKESLAYDLNGNITSLYRTTADANNNMVEMDDLTYAYESGNGNSNLLKNVSDAVSTQNTDGFVDGNTSLSLDDYEYDQNGNMIKDRNKGIESIHYNHLNLPVKVTWSNEKNISYQYNAAGQKLKKTVRDNDSIKIVDYLDGFQYAGNVLQFFPHAEGYVKASSLSIGGNIMNYAYNYVFNYTDHLGNVRLSYTKDPQTGTLDILDENHYYPFGLKHGVYAVGNLKDFTLNGDIDTPILEQVLKTDYNYKYQGQERQDELGLGWYSFKWRNYDPGIGRFFNIDPLSEKYVHQSHYNFSENRVVDGFELEGLEVVLINPTKSASSAQQKASDQRIVRGAKNISHSNTLVTVTAHGSPTGISNDYGKRTTTGAGLNTVLTANSDAWKSRESNEGMTVVLYSCRTGSDEKNKDGSSKNTSIAQQISASEEFKDVEIIAPDQRVYFSDSKPTGTYEAKYSGADDEYKRNENNQVKSKERSNTTGNWNVYKNGELIRSYQGDWQPTDNPSLWDRLTKEN
ncbi:MAG: RHS repeat-associated core domain-containing protein, partial [Weeksellaceae bacterium]